MPSGGARPGAGRPKMPAEERSKRIGVFLKLEPELNAWLAEQDGTKSDVANEAIRRYKSAIEAGKGK